ncbi:hypothetical protein [Rhizobium aethiopicum]|uniref:hypothetical protein n=1 Tax=Rhizobium aethiopicum TaxID=1138170 RepID=UPI0011309C0B|nr:hypothetical protein [Rhizobium aethiopicum]
MSPDNQAEEDIQKRRYVAQVPWQDVLGPYGLPDPARAARISWPPSTRRSLTLNAALYLGPHVSKIMLDLINPPSPTEVPREVGLSRLLRAIPEL